MAERLSNGLCVRLAARVDVGTIAQMSRQHVELGVGWSWRPERVLQALRAADCVVVGVYPPPARAEDPQSGAGQTPPPRPADARLQTDQTGAGGDPAGPVGFAIMQFGMEEAHLLLLCVAPEYRRKGVARALLAWLERAALTAGVSIVRLEQRADNRIARRFYEALGFCFVRVRKGYYAGRIDALEFARDLWASPPPG